LFVHARRRLRLVIAAAGAAVATIPVRRAGVAGRRQGLFATRPGAPTRKPLAGYALALGAALQFGVAGNVATLLIRDGTPASDLAQLRVLGSAALLLAAVPLRPVALRLPARRWPGVLAFGAVGLALVQLTYYQAIARVPLAVAGLLQQTGPILVLLVSVVAYRRRPSLGVWLLVGASLLGCWLVTGAYRFGLAPQDGAGVAWALASAAAFAAYFLIGERLVASLPLRAVLTWGYLVGAAAWLALDLAAGDPPPVPAGPALAGVAVVVVVGTLVPVAMATLALRLLGGPALAVSNVAVPAFSGLIAWFALHQRLAASQLAGAVLALAALGALQVVDVRTTGGTP
jgi:DME family drug/metabolite transporter